MGPRHRCGRRPAPPRGRSSTGLPGSTGDAAAAPPSRCSLASGRRSHHPARHPVQALRRGRDSHRRGEPGQRLPLAALRAGDQRVRRPGRGALRRRRRRGRPSRRARTTMWTPSKSPAASGRTTRSCGVRTGGAAERHRTDTSQSDEPCSSELGGVTPCIVAPGDWSAADFQYRAEHIVTSTMNNSGHNRVASQILILPPTGTAATACSARSAGSRANVRRAPTTARSWRTGWTRSWPPIRGPRCSATGRAG